MSAVVEQKKPQRTRIVKAGSLSYRPAEAAAVLGVSRSTIYEMIADGAIRAQKIRRATVIAHAELERVLSAAPDTEATKAAQASIR